MPLLSYYDVNPGRKDTSVADKRVLLVLFIVNATFAGTSLFMWTFLSLLIAEPIRWATWRGIDARPDLLDYPFVLLWLLPASGILAGWVAMRAQQHKLACWLAFFPIILLGLIFGWYYLTPIEWH